MLLAAAGLLRWDLRLAPPMPLLTHLAMLMLLVRSVPQPHPAVPAVSLILQFYGSLLPDPSIAVEHHRGDLILVLK
jgi:hypothetical protein